MADKTWQTAAGNRTARRGSVIGLLEWHEPVAANAITAVDLASFVMPFEGRILSVAGQAMGVGNGAGSTVINVYINGNSGPVLSIASADDNVMDVDYSNNVYHFKPGDIILISCAAVPAVAGHTGTSVVVAVGGP